MAQVQPVSNTPTALRLKTPPERMTLNPPQLSPGRIPDAILTSPSYRSGHFHLDTFSPVNQNGSFEFDRVIKSGKVLRRIKKKGAWKPSWKPTFLVLRPNLLSVYQNDNETELKASITLSEVTAVATVKKTNTDNVFGIFTPAKNYHFSGFSERDTSDWVALIRLEARTDQDDEMDLPAPGLHAHAIDNVESETTDMSAEDDVDRPGSPEVAHWAVRGSKSRSSTQTGQRKLSSLREYSGNDHYTTSQSDFSDAATGGQSASAPRAKSLVASSLPSHGSKLTPIPSDGPLERPEDPRSLSQTSLQNLTTPTTTQSQQSDPNRVIRQGHLHLLKTVSGVRQWKSIWAVLRPTGLSLYKSTSEYEPIKIVPIHSLIDAAEIDPISKSKRHCLQIISEEKTWKFNADTERELEGWLGALKSVLVRRSRGLSSAHGIQGTAPMPIPSSGLERGKENVGYMQSPPGPNRGSLRNDPGGLGGIVEGVNQMKAS